MYRLTKFGTNSLPGHNYSWTAGTPNTVEAIVSGVGGAAFDAYGFGDAPAVLPYKINYQCVLVTTSLTTMRTTFDLWRSLRGQQLKLYRMAENDSSEHWAWARMVEVVATNSVDDRRIKWQPLELVFQVMSSWYGAAQDDTFTLDASPKACALTNGGNVNVTDAVLTVTAGSAPITALTLTIGTSCNWTYDGTIAVGEALVVDSGAFSVLNDGANAYTDFELGAGHAVLEWIRLVPGTHNVTLAIAGGDVDSTAQFEYSDTWA